MATATAGGNMELGFGKLQGQDFEYFMQSYSIVLGRNSKNSTVDVDLSSLGGGTSVSRHHARIFYDFERRRFTLEVLGRNGCLVEGALHLPGNPPVELDSRDLIQIGEKEFYFLLPVRSILDGPLGPRHRAAGPGPNHNHHMTAPAPVKKPRRDGNAGGSGSGSGKPPLPTPMAKKSDGRSRVNRDADSLQLQLLEEKDVVSSVATVLFDRCGPGEWMAMEKLHAEMLEQYSSVWQPDTVRRYLTSEDWPAPESKGKPWYGLLELLRKYPKHFVTKAMSQRRVNMEFVSLVSLLS